MTYPLVALGDVIVGTTGTTNPTKAPLSKFTYIDVASVDNEQKRIVGAREILGSEAPSRARKLTRCNDVLVSTVRPNLNAVAIVSQSLDGAVASTGFAVLRATTAVFYSISNCQAGLQGVSFGNFLIKQVVDELRRDMPHLKTFVTLSPVPGFAQWLQREGKAALTAPELELLPALEQAGWHRSPGLGKVLQPVLMRAIGTYLLAAKHSSGKPRDPVARFHLNNGARLERVNWLGDVSDKGIREAAGFMVNYVYDLDDIEKNHENLANLGVVAASRQVRKLLRTKPPAVQAKT